jgi:hypothetical protein
MKTQQIFALIGIICICIAGFMNPDWKVKLLSVIYGIGNFIIFFI